MEHAIVGFEFTGDPLLEGTFLPLEEGLTVVYGLNGSGKTRLLTGITSALSGVRSNVGLGLIVRVAHPTADDIKEDGESGDRRCSGAGLLLALAQSQTGADTRQVAGRSRHYAEDLLSLARASEIVNRMIRSEIDILPDTREGLAEELLLDRLFLLYPTGTSETPSWEAWPVADPGGPNAKADLEMLARAKQTFDLDGDFDAWDLVMERSLILTPSEAGLTTRTRDQVLISAYAPYSGDKVGVMFPGTALHGPIDFGLDLLPELENVSEATISYLGSIVSNSLVDLERAWISERRFVRSVEDGVEMARVAEQSAKDASTGLEELAAEFLRAALFDAPEVSLQVMSVSNRFSGSPARWFFRRALGTTAVGLEDLSRAERRWAEQAITEALYWHHRNAMETEVNRLRPLLLVIDEPEAGLHRSAEAQMAQALVAQSRDPRRLVVAATHSPELLDLREAHILEVKRNAGQRGRSKVQPLDLSDRTALQTLGLNPSDLLRWPRIFLLVEGLHDELILDEYFDARLRAARVRILPLRGATKLPATIESRVLFDFTEAHVVALLDNQRGDELSSVWEEAQAARLLGTVDEATRIVVEGIRGKDEEARFMREWLTAALAKGLESRVTPYGLAQRDVIEYLPVTMMVSGAQDWTALRSEHADDRNRDKSTPHDFKKWLELTRNVEVTPDTLRAAVRADRSVPKELERLMKFLEAKAVRQ